MFPIFCILFIALNHAMQHGISFESSFKGPLLSHESSSSSTQSQSRLLADEKYKAFHQMPPHEFKSFLDGLIESKESDNAEIAQSAKDILNNHFHLIIKDKGLTYEYYGQYRRKGPSGYGILFFPGSTHPYQQGIWETANNFFAKPTMDLKGEAIIYYPPLDGDDRTQHRMQFKGDLKKGIADGKAIYYYQNGQIMYKGETKAATLHGQGMSFDEEGTILYDGSWVGGQRHGFGTIYKDGIRYYRGDIVKGIPHGTGTFYEVAHNRIHVFHGEKVFHGTVTNGEKTHGTLYENRVPVFTGSFIDGKPFISDF